MNDRIDGVFVPINRESPAGRQHLHTLTAGAWLPFTQSVITGFLLGLVATLIAYWLRARSPWNWGAGMFVIAWAWTWFEHQKHWFSLTALEQVTGLDLNRDGVIGDPKQIPEERIVHVRMDEVRDGGVFRQTRFDLPASESQLEELAIGILLQARSFSHRDWTGKGAPFSDSEFRDLRREMVRRELLQVAKGTDARQGFELTEAGRKVLGNFLPDAPHPTESMA